MLLDSGAIRRSSVLPHGDCDQYAVSFRTATFPQPIVSVDWVNTQANRPVDIRNRGSSTITLGVNQACWGGCAWCSPKRYHRVVTLALRHSSLESRKPTKYLNAFHAQVSAITLDNVAQDKNRKRLALQTLPTTATGGY